MKPRFYILMNEASDAGNGGGSAPMNAGQLAGFSNGGTSSPAQEQGGADSQATAETQPTPSAFDGFMATFGQQKQEAATTADTEKPGAETAGAANTEEQKKGGFDFEAWYAEKFPETPDPTKIAKVEDWKGMRSTLNVAMKDVQSLSAEKIMLEQKLAAAEKAQQGAGKGATLPETEAVKTLQAELETNRLAMEDLRQKYDGELSEYRSFKAAQDLSANPAFRAEYDGTRAAIKGEIDSIVKEAGLDEKVVESVLAAKSLLQIAKALEGIDDPTVKALIQERALKFADITTKRELALKGDPLQELAKWKDYAQMHQGILASNFTGALQQRLIAAVPKVVGDLTGEKGDIFFKTPAGHHALQQIGTRFDKGYDLDEHEVTTHMAKSAGFDFYAAMAKDLMGKLEAAEAKLVRYGAMDPAQDGGSPPSGGARSGGFDVGAMFAGMRP